MECEAHFPDSSFMPQSTLQTSRPNVRVQTTWPLLKRKKKGTPGTSERWDLCSVGSLCVRAVRVSLSVQLNKINKRQFCIIKVIILRDSMEPRCVDSADCLVD